MGTKRKKDSSQAQTQSSSLKKLRLDSDEKLSTNSGSLKAPDFFLFVEKPKGDELKKEVELYEKLASEEESQRINAANSIFAGLFDGDGASESTLHRHLERRLLRGLASGRKGARIGFSIVLTEVLSHLYGNQKLAQTKYANLPFERVFLLLKEKMKPEGDLSGQEIKDHALGLLFGLQSFVRAKILFVKTENWKLVLEEILGLAKKKPWIRQECGWMLIEALEQMDHDQVLVTLNALCDQGLSKTPEGVGIWLIARNKYPLLQDKSLPKVWGDNANPLDQLQSLARVLRESSEPEKKGEELDQIQQAKQTGNWNAKLHFVWDIILKQFTMMSKDTEERSIAEFGNFWKIIVDENLFAHTASRERKFWGFLLFQKVLEDSFIFCPVIPCIFSHNLLRCLINHSQDKDRFLNRAAEKSLRSVVNAVKSNRQILPDVLRNLVDSHGTCNFDRITKTKTISQLLDSVTEDNVKNVIDVLETVANEVHGDNEEVVSREVESRRIMLGDNLLRIIRKPVPIQENQPTLIRALILKTLAKYAYTKIDGIKTPISEKSRVLFRSRLMSALTHILTDLGGYKYVCDLLKECDPSAIGIDSSIGNVIKNAKSNLRKILKKIKILNSDEDNIVVLQAFAFLYSLMILQLYNGEPEAISCLDELDLCYQKLICEKMIKESKSQVLDILVELLLSLISKPSALMRKMAKFVFRAFVSQISETGLKLMTDILITDESLRGQKKLFDEELEISQDEAENNSDSDLEDNDMDADKNSLNLQLTEESSASDQDNSSDSSSDDFYEEDKEETEKLNTALAVVLGRDPKTSADESDDDVDMTDSEMLALDDKLVEIFSQRKRIPKKKKEEKSAKENICNFKTRVLDLIEIYVKGQAQNELAFSLIMPLLILMHNTQNKSLADRSHTIIQSFAKVYKNNHPLGSGPVKSDDHRSPPSGRLELLREIHELACKDKSHSFCKAASSASLLVVSSMYRIDIKFINDAANIYRDTQVKWVLGEARIQTAFFIEWVNWCQSHALNLRKEKTR